MNHKSNVSIVKQCLAESFYMQGQYEKSLDYFEEAFEIIKKIDYRMFKWGAVIGLAASKKKLGIDNWSKRFMKEFGVALINGLICCSLVFVICYFFYNDKPAMISLNLTVSISLLTVMVFAALFGTFVPLILNKYKIDPAVATGPFITTMNDVIGLFIYFKIAELILIPTS